MSKHHLEDVTSAGAWIPYVHPSRARRGSHRLLEGELLPAKAKDPYAHFRANIEDNARRFSPSPHASIAAAVMQLSGKQWNLQWTN